MVLYNIANLSNGYSTCFIPIHVRIENVCINRVNLIKILLLNLNDVFFEF